MSSKPTNPLQPIPGPFDGPGPIKPPDAPVNA